MTTTERIIKIIKELKGGDIQEDNLIRSGFLDSFDMIKLTDAIAREFKKNIEGKDITEENFNSVRAIAALVEK
ncbi:MAG TPA: acyl carrier protein [Candidatus Nanoarchaeia archaeon]|nr:acyl carrier protein [Candidatus Nanoarchaeia archaeon]HLC20081.1 acyl carrier protein [Candidatus Nanoarchaeia archaeon]